MIYDWFCVDKNRAAIILRYFNPAGASKTSILGEEPRNQPNNIFPKLVNVALKRQKNFFIYGNGYKTKDGTCLRDYIHIEDLSEGHICALKYIKNKKVKHFGSYTFEILNWLLAKSICPKLSSKKETITSTSSKTVFVITPNSSWKALLVIIKLKHKERRHHHIIVFDYH